MRAHGILPDQGSNVRPLPWQVDSQPLHHQISPRLFCFVIHNGMILSYIRKCHFQVFTLCTVLSIYIGNLHNVEPCENINSNPWTRIFPSICFQNNLSVVQFSFEKQSFCLSFLSATVTLKALNKCVADPMPGVGGTWTLPSSSACVSLAIFSPRHLFSHLVAACLLGKVGSSTTRVATEPPSGPPPAVSSPWGRSQWGEGDAPTQNPHTISQTTHSGP